MQLWHDLGVKNLERNKFDTNLSHKLYHIFKSLGFNNIQLETNQPILTTKREKSVYSLGFLSSKEQALISLDNNEDEYNRILNEIREIEASNAIIGFFRNILISGIK